MGIQVAVTLDDMIKPNYTVSTVLAPAFAVAAGALVIWVGNDHNAGKSFEITGVRKCLDAIRDFGSTTPASGKHSYAKLAAPGFLKDVSTGENVADITTLTGTVTITAGLKAVVGVGTLFTTELVVGDVIKIGTEFLTVSAISTALTLATAEAHVAGAAGAVYSISNTPAEQDVGIWFGDLFQPTPGSTLTPHVLRALEKYMESALRLA
jgi:hypothetical protein